MEIIFIFGNFHGVQCFFQDVFEAQGKLVCLQILDVGSRIRWYVFWIRSHVFTMSRPQQLLEVNGHPTQQLMLSLDFWIAEDVGHDLSRNKKQAVL